MAGYTRRAIRETFLALLEEKPFGEITVKLIVETCGINRKTFYNHYRDIPDLLETVIREEAAAIIENSQCMSSMEDCFRTALEFALEHKRAVLHIYDSVSRDIYIESLLRLCDHLMRTYVESAVGDRKMNPHDRELLVGLYRSECFGEISAWIMEGMQRDILQDLRRICELRSGMTEEFIRRSMEQC